MAQQLHFLMIPLMSQSHIIPLTDFAKSLARRGALVSIVTTPLNAKRYNPTLASSPRIHLIPLHFPCREAGLPDGCENLDSLNSLDLARQFFHACRLLKSPLHDLIRRLHPSPNCIISTSAISWTQDLADSFRIPRYVFETVSSFTLHCSRKISHLVDSVSFDSELFQVPQIPHSVEFSRNQLPRIRTRLPTPDPAPPRGTLVNTFQELEPWYLNACMEERGSVWSVGPVSLSNRGASERFSRGNEASIDEHYCLKWLDSMERDSVVYACFGSLCTLSIEQITEIGLGLEESNSPFIWVIRKQEKSCGEVEEWLAAEGFEERVRGRGVVVQGWAPQVMILAHPSVGGFLTHCGWNSTLEGVAAGVPMIAWPMFAEQFYNEKMVVDSCADKQGLVRRERVRSAVVELMGERGMRERAEALARAATDAFEDGGSSFLNVTLFIEDVVRANAEMAVNVLESY
ncbi:UDP-glycosyltransferase 73C6-like isoform X2 [Salvia splendens]|uniref:UDP-glycosyltransferase 73C6-like isoform X2 n=1 Tax=Salvia splendens TaxID=180675 RepID=UPI001C27E6F2|nr:UDP-glycosyltransferase 73C6-like isoform X2 [Salvia splendens]